MGNNYDSNGQYGLAQNPMGDQTAAPAPKSKKGLVIGLACLVGVLLIAAAIILVLILKQNSTPTAPVYPIGAPAAGNQTSAGVSAPAEEAAASEWEEAAVDAEEPAETAVEAPAVEAERPAEEAAQPAEDLVRIALILDGDSLYDGSYNQAVYEGLDALNRNFAYYTTDYFDGASYTESVNRAIDDGYNVIVMTGFMFEEATATVAPAHKDVKFILLDDVFDSLSWYNASADFSNVICVSFQEELAGYMAGYAAVRLGYTKLGVLGGMAVPAVVRYGYGFVQGADDAAAELGLNNVVVYYAYANQFYGDGDITAAMDTWYADGVEVVFSCGGGVFTSVGEAAEKAGGLVIGSDTDMAPMIDGTYGEGITLTSPIKAFGPALEQILRELDNGRFQGGDLILGIGSADPSKSFIQLAPSTRFGAGFTRNDYASLIRELYNGTRRVSSDTAVSASDLVSAIQVIDLGNLK